MRAWLARAVVLALVISAMPQPAAAARLYALPDTIRVNIAGLGVTYAKIGSSATLIVTNADGAVVYRGGARTVTQRDVRRLANPRGPVAAPPDPFADDERREHVRQLREARNAAKIEGVALVTVPFEFSIDEVNSDPLAPPLIASQKIVPLHFESSDGLLSFNGRIFRGTFDLMADDEGDMVIVNEVSTASYLASVVGSEEPTTWASEALAAQAIAARTYLATHLRRHAAYDLEGDTRDQEYDGISGEATSTSRAVQRTAGIIATFRGAPIEALYSANAGGHTEDSENVYANALPYLRAVPSPTDEIAQASSWGHTSWQWLTEFTAPQLRSYLGSRGVDVGDVRQIDLLRFSDTGRVLRARIVGSTGSRDIGKDTTRYYFGLRSSLFTVTTRPEETEFVSLTDETRIRQLGLLGATIVRTQRTPLRDPDITQRRVLGWTYRLPARFVFTGRGYGHGVGMSQWGAQGMALAGKTAEQILKHYYRGIELTNVGGP